MTFLCFTDASFAAVSKLSNIRLSHLNDNSRIVLETNKAISYKYFTLDMPDRLVVDLQDAKLGLKLNQVITAKTPIKAIRSSARGKKDLRLVFDLKQSLQANAFQLKPDNKGFYRLVIDLKSKQAKKTVSKKATLTDKPIKKLRDVVIVIDPGHGGKDPGATGARRTREKDIVLKISKTLKDLINKQPGMHAELTRKGDYYLTLRQRLNLARKDKADIFIAVHADAFKNKKSRGASVFALSQRGASSEAARWLAAKENYSELGGADLSNKDHLVRSVLIDLSQTATIGSSLQLGSSVLKNVGTIAILHNKKVEQARFVVLKSPDIPSILIETGFISNPREELNLRSSGYRNKLAKAILTGIRNYFWAHAPQGTLIASQRYARTYKVAKGDSLGKIAQRYHVGLASLKQFNKLNSNQLRIGQTLRIPQA